MKLENIIEKALRTAARLSENSSLTEHWAKEYQQRLLNTNGVPADEETAAQRIAVCEECPSNGFTETRKCAFCSCWMDVKTKFDAIEKAIVNPLTGEDIIIHMPVKCPKGHW